jgi:hypothetical protein
VSSRNLVQILQRDVGYSLVDVDLSLANKGYSILEGDLDIVLWALASWLVSLLVAYFFLFGDPNFIIKSA